MGNETNPKLEYLDQGYVAKRDKQTFALQFALSSPSPNDKTPVLCLHGQYSRFILTLIDNTGSNRNILKVNIKSDEVPYLFRQYELASAAKFEHKNMAKPIQENVQDRCFAFETKIRAGEMKGRTPGEILMEDPNKVNELNRHRCWLVEHATQYPKNTEIITAIDDAMYLLSTNQLAANASSYTAGGSRTSATIFKEDFKYMSSGASEPNMKTGVKVHATCEFEDQFPWKFYIENSDVPMFNGKPNWNQAKNKRMGVIRLTDMEMDCLIYRMRSLMQLFESYVFADAYRFVQNNQNAWRNQANQNSQNPPAVPVVQYPVNNAVPYGQNGQSAQGWNGNYNYPNQYQQGQYRQPNVPAEQPQQWNNNPQYGYQPK